MRKLLALLASLVVATSILAAPPSAEAIKTGTFITIWESADYTGDAVSISGWSGAGMLIPDLRNYTTGLTGACNTGGAISVGWDNCVSSYAVRIRPGDCIGMYAGYSYTGTALYYRANTGTSDVLAQLGNMGAYNDTASSIRLGAYNFHDRVCNWGH